MEPINHLEAGARRPCGRKSVRARSGPRKGYCVPKKCPKKSQTRDKSTGRCRTKRNLKKKSPKSVRTGSLTVGQQRLAQAMEAAEQRRGSRRSVLADVLNVPEQMAETLPLNPLADIRISRQATVQGPQRREAVIAENFAELPIPRASLIAEQERQQRMKDYQREIQDELQESEPEAELVAEAEARVSTAERRRRQEEEQAALEGEEARAEAGLFGLGFFGLGGGRVNQGKRRMAQARAAARRKSSPKKTSKRKSSPKKSPKKRSVGQRRMQQAIEAARRR